VKEYIRFELVHDTGKTEIWEIYSITRGTYLGDVRWYGPWRQYCFFPAQVTVFNKGCMLSIMARIDALMAQRRGK